MPEVFTIKQNIVDFKNKVDLNSAQVDEITYKIIKPYTEELDKLINNVKQCLETVNDITTNEFETLALKIPCILYWTTGGLELVGIRSDIAKAFEKEKYNRIYETLSGTAKERESIATLETQAESIVTIAVSRAYKILHAKAEAAYELLAAVKKVLNRRIEEGGIPSV